MMEVIAHSNPPIESASAPARVHPVCVHRRGDQARHRAHRRAQEVARIPHNAADPSALMLLSTEQRSGSGGSASSVPSWVEWARGSDGNVRIGPSASPFDSATNDNDSFPAAEDVGARRVSRGEAQRDSLRVNWYPQYVDIDAPDVRALALAVRPTLWRTRAQWSSVSRSLGERDHAHASVHLCGQRGCPRSDRGPRG